jgi:hypothetical protein
MQRLPLYHSLQAPSRFLAAVIFVAAICGGYGIDRLGRWAARVGGSQLRAWLVYGLAAAIYIELATLGWSLLGDIFICQPRPVPHRKAFAERYADDAVRYSIMYSAHYPYLKANSGVIRDYENIAIPRGKVRITSDPNYRGEAYLQGSRGAAKIDDWSMSRVGVHVEADGDDRLVLNQNYSPGWKAIRRAGHGKIERLPAEANDDGLVSLAVGRDDREVEFYYLPDSVLWGAGISAIALLGCIGLLIAIWRSKRHSNGRIAGQEGADDESCT